MPTNPSPVCSALGLSSTGSPSRSGPSLRLQPRSAPTPITGSTPTSQAGQDRVWPHVLPISGIKNQSLQPRRSQRVEGCGAQQTNMGRPAVFPSVPPLYPTSPPVLGQGCQWAPHGMQEEEGSDSSPNSQPRALVSPWGKRVCTIAGNRCVKGSPLSLPCLASRLLMSSPREPGSKVWYDN